MLVSLSVATIVIGRTFINNGKINLGIAILVVGCIILTRNYYDLLDSTNKHYEVKITNVDEVYDNGYRIVEKKNNTYIIEK